MSNRELDVEVAEKVMGWRCYPDHNYWMTVSGDTLQLHALIATWKPSESVAAAMEVVENFIAQGGRVSMVGGLPEGEPPESVAAGEWHVNFYRFFQPCPQGTRFSFNAKAATLPEAICNAAIQATTSAEGGDNRVDTKADSMQPIES